MTDKTNAFARLAEIDVSRHLEKKGEFTYLSWPYAVAQLRLAEPDATWEVKRFDGLPFLATECGYFVEVAVTVRGLTLSQIHPVLDGRNRPIASPTAFDINTSIQRALVKAIGLHGLGLSVYAGEDLPRTDAQPVKEKPSGSTVHPLHPPITTNQRRYIERLLRETDTTLESLLEYFGYESLEVIPKSEASRVISALESQRRAA